MLGIDSAATSGWAFLSPQDGKWYFGTVRACSLEKHDVIALAKEHGVAEVCIEKPQPFKLNGAWQIETYGVQRENYGRWLEACAIAGVAVHPTRVISWQAYMFKIDGVRLEKNHGGVDKGAAKFVAARLGALGFLTGDMADAICIAAFGPTAKTNNALAVEKERVKKNKVATAKRRAKKVVQ